MSYADILVEMLKQLIEQGHTTLPDTVTIDEAPAYEPPISKDPTPGKPIHDLEKSRYVLIHDFTNIIPYRELKEALKFFKYDDSDGYF